MNIIILALLAAAQVRYIDAKCDLISVHNINHKKLILKNNINSPYQLTIDHSTNTLFFSFTISEGFKSAYLNLSTKEYATIPGIPVGFASAVDDENHIVYLGGTDGIYKYDYASKTAKRTNITDKNIWQMFYKNGLYFTDYPNEKAYYYKDGVTTEVPELITTKAMLVAVDNNKNIFFANSSGLFCYKKVKGTAVYMGEYTINGFTADESGNLYFSTPNKIYSIEAEGRRVDQMLELDDIYGLAIEKDSNIIYAEQNNIVRLEPTKDKCNPDI